jgi:hypothetical protein
VIVKRSCSKCRAVTEIDKSKKLIKTTTSEGILCDDCRKFILENI